MASIPAINLPGANVVGGPPPPGGQQIPFPIPGQPAPAPANVTTPVPLLIPQPQIPPAPQSGPAPVPAPAPLQATPAPAGAVPIPPPLLDSNGQQLSERARGDQGPPILSSTLLGPVNEPFGFPPQQMFSMSKLSRF
jgi:hypothetical protein